MGPTRGYGESEPGQTGSSESGASVKVSNEYPVLGPIAAEGSVASRRERRHLARPRL
jgi:hypothetical protein